MELRDYIDEGTNIIGSQKGLAEAIGQYPSTLRRVRVNRKGLPIDACIKLAKIIDADPLEVIAASELVTEKKPEKRAFWAPFCGTRKDSLHPANRNDCY
jgi:plasmid maintenance system antidote protein VapI